MIDAEQRAFGALLRRFRLAAGLSQEALAARAGLSARGISDLERGARRTPQLATIDLLADALTLSPADRALLASTVDRRRKLALAPTQAPPEPARPPTHALPVPPTPLLGREREEAAVVHLLRRDGARLVTITGPGGVGKTRLALQVAATLAPEIANGVAFVDLSPLTDPALVAGTIAHALGLHDTGNQTPPARLADFLRAQDLLLILDNFEQVAPAATLVAELLATCPALRLLITSRAPLHLRAAQEFPLRPLALPPTRPTPTRPLPPATLSRYPAVELFLQRARAARPDFHPTTTNAGAIVAICQRLDGLPLAIELAAAWTRLLPPETLLARLDQRLPAPTNGAGDRPARHRTLRDTIAWSHDLLDEETQALFRRLATFVGGAPLTAVERICAEAGHETADEPNFALLDGLATLVAQSLLLVEDVAALDGTVEPRFRMLETIRAFALARLEASGEAVALRQRHATYYAALVLNAEPALRARKQHEWLALLDREYDNLRAALTRLATHEDATIGLELAQNLWRFWSRRGYLAEGRAWLATFLARASGPPTMLHADALFGAGRLAYEHGDDQAARVIFNEALVLSRAIGYQELTAGALTQLGHLALNQGEHTAARALYEEGLTIRRALGARWGIAVSLTSLGEALAALGDFAAARQLYAESLDLHRATGDWLHLARTFALLSSVTQALGDLGATRAHLIESLTLYRDLGDQQGIATGLEGFAALAVAQARPILALRLVGAATNLRGSIGVPPLATWHDWLTGALAPAYLTLNPNTAAAALAEGQELPLTDAIAEALT